MRTDRSLDKAPCFIPNSASYPELPNLGAIYKKALPRAAYSNILKSVSILVSARSRLSLISGFEPNEKSGAQR
jgi:hypothetical protein